MRDAATQPAIDELRSDEMRFDYARQVGMMSGRMDEWMAEFWLAAMSRAHSKPVAPMIHLLCFFFFLRVIP